MAMIVIVVVAALMPVMMMAVMFVVLVMPYMLHMARRAVIIMTVHNRLVIIFPPFTSIVVGTEQIAGAYLDVPRGRAVHEARAFVVFGKRRLRAGDHDRERCGKGQLM